MKKTGLIWIWAMIILLIQSNSTWGQVSFSASPAARRTTDAKIGQERSVSPSLVFYWHLGWTFFRFDFPTYFVPPHPADTFLKANTAVTLNNGSAMRLDLGLSKRLFQDLPIRLGYEIGFFPYTGYRDGLSVYTQNQDDKRASKNGSFVYAQFKPGLVHSFPLFWCVGKENPAMGIRYSLWRPSFAYGWDRFGLFEAKERLSGKGFTIAPFLAFPIKTSWGTGKIAYSFDNGTISFGNGLGDRKIAAHQLMLSIDLK